MLKAETKQIRRDGDVRIDASALGGDSVTVYIDGDFGGARLDLFAANGGIHCPVFDGGNLTSGETDNREAPARRIVVSGRMETLIVRASDTTAATKIRVNVA